MGNVVYVPTLIVGAGPAGLACARALQLRGEQPLVLERREFPSDKVCGEGVLPVGLRCLQRLGVELTGGRSFPGITYRLGPSSFRADFAEGPGRGLRRPELVRALCPQDLRLETSTRLLSVRRLAHRVEVETSRGSFACRLLIAADGLHSSVRRALAWEARSGPLQRWGWRQHFHCSPWCDDVEVHYGQGCEAYVTPVGEHLVGVAVLSGKGRQRQDWLRGLPALQQRLLARESASPLAGYGPLWQSARKVHAPGVLLVGDAAGYLDACTGEGLSLAFAQALALAEEWPGSSSGLVHLRGYAARYRKIVAHYKWVTGALLALNHAPALHRSLMRGLQSRPRLLQTLLSANQGLAGPRELLRALL